MNLVQTSQVTSHYSVIYQWLSSDTLKLVNYCLQASQYNEEEKRFKFFISIKLSNSMDTH